MPRGKRLLVYRHSGYTRVAHWVWALCLLLLAGSGLNIFMAHPVLYIGDQSGFEFDNAVLAVGAVRSDGLEGVVQVFGHRFVTTGVLGVSDGMPRAIPAWASIPSYPDLATARIIHFFFAWLLVAVWSVWMVSSVLNGHLRGDILPGWADWRDLPRQARQYLRFRFAFPASYNCLQKVSYAGVMVILLPLMVLTGLAMSPAAHAIFPPLGWMFGGRETARTLHFFGMSLLAAFALIHVAMVFLTEPINGLRGMITGWARSDAPEQGGTADERT